MAELNRLAAAAGHHNHLSVLVGVRAYGIDHGGAAVHLSDDIIADHIGIGGDDRKILAQIDALDHGIHDERFDDEAEQREQAGADAEHKTGRGRDQRVAHEQRFADIEARVLLEDHRHNVRAAARSVAVEENRRADRRQHHREAQLEERLIRERLGHRVDDLKKPGEERVQHAAVRRHQAEAAAEKQKADYKQNRVDNPHRNGRRKKRNEPGEQNRDTADAARRKMIRELEKIDADSRENRAEGNHKKIIDFSPADAFYWVVHFCSAPVRGLCPLYFDR